MDKNSDAFVKENNRLANDFVEKYLEPFLLSLGGDPSFYDEIKKKHFAHGASVSYIDEDTPDVITVEYPDGKKEFIPCKSANS